MKITKTYSIGDIVYIEPYEIFSNPMPIGWDTDIAGYGEKYIPG